MDILNQPKPKRVVIYARVSTADQDLENQLAALREYAGQQGWIVIDSVVDVGSGSKGRSERQGLDGIFKLAHQRKVDLVLFWALDRFSREGSRVTIGYLTQLEGMGVGFHSYSEPYLSTLGVFADCIISLLAALAKQERIRIGERTKAGLERAKAGGKRLGRPASSEDKAMEAKRLKREGYSVREIAVKMGVSRSRAHQLAQGHKQDPSIPTPSS